MERKLVFPSYLTTTQAEHYFCFRSVLDSQCAQAIVRYEYEDDIYKAEFAPGIDAYFLENSAKTCDFDEVSRLASPALEAYFEGLVSRVCNLLVLKLCMESLLSMAVDEAV